MLIKLIGLPIARLGRKEGALFSFLKFEAVPYDRVGAGTSLVETTRGWAAINKCEVRGDSNRMRKEGWEVCCSCKKIDLKTSCKQVYCTMLTPSICQPWPSAQPRCLTESDLYFDLRTLEEGKPPCQPCAGTFD